MRDVNEHAAAAVTGNRRTSTVIGIATLNQACMVCCRGALDGPAVADLRDALHAARRASSTVLVDARDVARVNSAGLAVLVAASRLLRGDDGTLRLTAPSPSLQRALTLTGLRALLPTDPPGPTGWDDLCAASTGIPAPRQPCKP